MRKLGYCFSVVAIVVAFAVPAHAQVGYSSAVAAGDGEIFVGEPGNQATSGFVYVYRAGASGWREVARLAASDADGGDRFGASLTVDGDLLVVGKTSGNGTVYIFRRDGDDWTEIGSLSAVDGAEGDQFGGATAISGELLLVGAPGANEGSGATYVFQGSGGSWTQVAKVEMPEIEEPEEQQGGRGGRRGGGQGGQGQGGGGFRGRPLTPRFGSAMAIDGDWAMIGAPNAARRAGNVFVYHREGDSWQRVAELPGNNTQQGATFGSAIFMAEGEALIGATGSNGGLGAVNVYALNEDDEWGLSSRLTPFESQAGGGRGGFRGGGGGFGSAFVVSGNDVLIGSSSAGGREGRIYRYTRDRNGNWTGASKIAAAGLAAGDRFGATMAGNDDLLVVGKPGDDYGAGTAVIMTRTDYGWDSTTVASEISNYPMHTGSDLRCDDGMAGPFPCDNVDLLAFMPVHEIGGTRGLRTNDIWGWTDPDTGKDYVMVGMLDRASFVDVTDPYNPVHVGVLMKNENSPPSTWRDMKVRNNWVYIVADGAREHGIQVFDLTRLREFDGEPIEFTENAHYDGIGSSHNIVINPETDFAYAVGAGGPNGCGGGLHIVNIEDPNNPTFVSCFQDMNTGRRGTGYSHDAMCITYHGPDDRYDGHEVCFGSNETALSIADVTDKRNPVALGMATYPNVAYTHQGWITDDHAYFFMNDELDEGRGLVEGTRTLIWDVQDLEDPILVKEYVSDNPATDHNLYIVGDYMYQSNYDSGLRVYNISDPENPVPLGFIDTVPYQEGGGMTGSWSNYPFFESGIVVVTSGREGILIVRPRGR